jgi:hypothetical protein
MQHVLYYVPASWVTRMKQREKCLKAATALVEEGTSVVVGELPIMLRIHAVSE